MKLSAKDKQAVMIAFGVAVLAYGIWGSHPKPEVMVHPNVATIEQATPKPVVATYPEYAIALYHDGTTKTFTKPELGNTIIWQCQVETASPDRVRVYSTESGACIETSIDSSRAVKQAVLGFRASN